MHATAMTCSPEKPSTHAAAERTLAASSVDAALLTWAEVACGEDVSELTRTCRRGMLVGGAAVHDVFTVASVLVELGTQAVRERGLVRIEIWQCEDELEVLVFEIPPSDAPRVAFGLTAGAIARVMDSVELRQGGSAGLRVRATLTLDRAGTI